MPDFIRSSPLLLLSPPKVVPASFNNTSAPSASNITSPSASSVISPEDSESISAIFGVVKVLFVKVCVAAIPATVSVVAGKVNVMLPEKAEWAGACNLA